LISSEFTRKIKAPAPGRPVGNPKISAAHFKFGQSAAAGDFGVSGAGSAATIDGPVLLALGVGQLPAKV
jgi:hypothetical protein